MEAHNEEPLFFVGERLHFDCAATSALYPFEGCNDNCECCNCTNFRRAKRKHFPRNMAEMLRQFCIDPFEPQYASKSDDNDTSAGWIKYVGHYGLIGTLSGTTQTSAMETDEGCWLWIASSPDTDQSSVFTVSNENVPGPHLFVQYSIILPWVLTSEEEDELGCEDLFVV